MFPTTDKAGPAKTLRGTTLCSKRCPVRHKSSPDRNPPPELGGDEHLETVPGNLGDVKDNRKLVSVMKSVEKDLLDTSSTATGVLGLCSCVDLLRGRDHLADCDYCPASTYEVTPLITAACLKTQTTVTMTPVTSIPAEASPTAIVFLG